MKPFRCLLFCIFCWSAPLAHAEKITIAAASDLKFALDEVAANFRKTHTDDRVDIVYGSSGKLFTQIQQDAPYDLYFAADIAYPQKLAQAGLTASEVRPYAYGRIVLWSPTLDASKLTLQDLTAPMITRIAIANPKHAPYGRRAEEALRSAGIWDQVQPKLVFGENIAQTAQFVQTGNAPIGIIALSLALNPELAKTGAHYLIPETLHEPLEQGFAILKRAAENPLAESFAAYFASQPALDVLTRYGFMLPTDR
ncbi:MAG: molybdate ABC transporter substrate-binding protein [Methylomicrobium sp.]